MRVVRRQDRRGGVVVKWQIGIGGRVVRWQGGNSGGVVMWQGGRFEGGGCRVIPRFHCFVSDVNQRNEGAGCV